jgi:gliding motility-associated-like protein/uncharacterized repeat protein (TIGR01451 family)
MDSTRSLMTYNPTSIVIRLYRSLFFFLLKGCICREVNLLKVSVFFLLYQPLFLTATAASTTSNTSPFLYTKDILWSITATTSPGVIDSNQTICYGTTPATITNTISPAGTGTLTYFWQQSVLAAFSGYNNIPATNSLTYSSGILIQTTWFRRAVTNGIDTSYADPVKITVVTTPHNTITAAQTICSGTSPVALTGPNIAGLSFRWLSSTTSATAGFAPATGTNNTQNYAPGVLTQNTWYKRADALGSCTADTTSAVMITVSPVTVGGTPSGGGTFCVGPGYTFVHLNGYTGNIVKWQSSPSPTFSSAITDIVFSSSPYPATTASASSLYYRAIVKNGVCPPETSSVSAAVIVIPQTVAGMVTGGTTVCAPANSTVLTLTGYTGKIIKWQSSLSDDFSSGLTDIADTTNALTINNLTVKTYYRAFVQNGSCNLFFSGKDSIRVAPAMLGGTLSGGATVCAGTNSTTLTLSGYNGIITNWQWCASPDFSTGITNIFNTSNTYTATNLTATRYYRAVTVSPACASYPSGYSAIDSIVVIPQALGGTLMGGATVCSGTNSTLLTLIASSGTILRWQSSPNASFSSGVVTISNLSTTYTATNLGSTTYYRVVIQNGSCPQVLSSVVSVIVSPQTVGGTLTGGGGVCPSPNSKTMTLTGYTGTIQKWQSSPLSDFSSGVADIANTANTYAATNLLATTYYRVVVQYPGCVVLNSSVATINVSPTIIPGTLSGGTGYCSSTNNTTFTLSGYTGNIVRWESCLSNNFSSGVTFITNTSANLNIINRGVTTYYRALLANSIMCAGVYSAIDSINIYPVAVAGNISGNQDTVCSGTNSILYTLTGSVGSIQWQSSTSSATTGFSNITGANASTYTASNLVFKTYFRAVVSSGVCPVAITAADSVFMNPGSAYGGTVSGNNDSICAVSNSTIFTLSGYVGTIQWQTSTTSATAGFSDILGANTATYTANNLFLKTYFRAVVSNGACTVAISTVDSVMIHPVFIGGNLSGGNAVCTGINSTLLTLSGYTGAIAYWQWCNVSDFSTVINNIVNTGNTYTAVNLTGTRYYRAVVMSLTCPGYPLSYSTVDSITVNTPATSGILSGGTTACVSSNSTVLTVTGYSGTILRWESSPNRTFSSGVVTIANTLNTYTATNVNATTYYRVVIGNLACPLVLTNIDSVVTIRSVGGTILSNFGGCPICPSPNSSTLTLTGYSGTILKWQSCSKFAFLSSVTDISNTSNTYTVSNLSNTTYYRAIVQNSSCYGVYSSIVTVSVNPTVVPGKITGGATYCGNTNNTILTLSGIVGGVVRWESCLSSNFTSGVTNIPSNALTLNIVDLGVKTYYRALVANSITCAGIYSTIDSIVVNPVSVGGIVSGNHDTVCIGSNSTILTLSGAIGTIQWQSSVTSATSGFSNISGATNSIYTATNLSAKTYFRAVVTKGSCPAEISAVDSVLLNLPPIGGIVLSNNDSVCIGNNSTTLTVTGYTGDIQWQTSTSTATTGFSDINGAHGIAYFANNLSATTYFRVLITNGYCPADTSKTDSVFVNQASVGGNISGADSVCIGINSTVLTLSGYTGTVIRWESALNPGFTGIVTQIANTTNTYTATNLSAITYFRALVQNGNCPIEKSAVKSVLIVSPSFGGFITAPSTVCINNNSSVLTISTYSGSILRWESSPNFDFSGTVTPLPFTGASYPVNNISAPTYYRAVVQNVVCPLTYSQVGFINVQVQPNPGTVVGGGNVCITSNSSLLSLVGYQGNIVRWESAHTDDFSGTITPIANTTTTYSVNNITTTTYYRAVVQYLNCATVNSAAAGIIVAPFSEGGTVAATNDSVCFNINSTLLKLSGHTGSIQWQSSVIGAGTGFNNITGATNITYVADNLLANTFFRALVTSGICSSDTSSVDSVLVNPLSVGGTVSGSSDTVCIKNNSIVLTVTGYTGILQWQVSTTSDTSGFSNISGAYLPTYTATNLSGNTYYRAIATSGACPSSFSVVDSVLINPLSAGGVVTASTGFVCTGTNSTLLTLTGYTGTIQWQVSTSSATSGFSNISGANTSTYTATDLSVKTYFRAIVTSGECPPSSSTVDSILVHALSVGGIVSGNNDTVCIGNNSTILTLTGYTGTIQWQSSASIANSGFGLINGANNATYTADSLVTKTYFRAIVTNGVCPASISAIDSVLLNPPLLNNNISGNIRLCYGSDAGILNGTIPTGGNGSTYSYAWISSTVNGETNFGAASGINNTKNYAPGVLTQHTWYKRIVFSGPCSVDTSNVLMDTVSLKIAYTIQPLPISIVYGTALPLPEIFVKYVDSTSEMRPVSIDTTLYNPNVGAYHYLLSIMLAPGTCNPGNLTGIYTVTILPRTITVKADKKIKAEATPDPPLTYTIISGILIGSDTFSGSLSRKPGEAVGRYPIFQNTLSLSSNYTLIYLRDSLTITINLMNLSVNKTTPTLSVYSGESVSYTIRITNYGPDSLQPGQTLFINELPENGLTIGTYISPDGVYNRNNGELTLNSSFLPGQYVELLVDAEVDVDYNKDSIGNFVFVELPDYILNTGQSRDSAFVLTSRLVDLSISKWVNKDTAQSSDTITYSIVVKNNGPSKLYPNEHIYIQEFLPDSLTGLVFTPVRPLGSSYNAGTTAYSLGNSLAAGDSVILNLKGTIVLEYTKAAITNCVKVKTATTVFDNDSTNDSSGVILPLKLHALANNINVSDQTICKGNTASITLGSIGIVNPVYTWYADHSLTIPLSHSAVLDTLLLSTTSFYITVKGDNRPENIPGAAKKITVSVFDYASDTLIETHDTIVCYHKSATLIAKPKGIITNPVFTWYATPSLNTPIATGDTFHTGILIADTLYYVTIKGSSLCESRELHLVKITINKNCGNINIGLSKSLAKTEENADGSFDLTFNFVTKNFGDEPLTGIKLKDDLKPVFPTAQIKVLSLSGNWILNNNYDGVNDIELLDTGNVFEVEERQTVQLVINLLFPPNDTSTQFKNVAEISGMSQVNGKPIMRLSKDGLEPDPDSLSTDSTFVPTPIIIKPKVKPKPKPKPQDAGEFFIPEGFSPNNDHVNDYFVIENPDHFTLYVAIYNRWGNILYENPDYDHTWDGKAQKGMVIGEGVPDGTYFYIVEYTDTENKKHTFAHSLTIVR